MGYVKWTELIRAFAVYYAKSVTCLLPRYP